MNCFKSNPVKPTVTINDLNKLDIRVGTIKSVEDILGSDKLIKLLVDFGDFERTILVGMKNEKGKKSKRN